MEMVTRTFVDATTVTFKKVIKGEVGQSEVMTIKGKVSDPIKTIMKLEGLGKLDSVIIVSLTEDSKILGVPVEQFKSIAVEVPNRKVEE